ncbi:MAG: transcription-repair coupling factor [Alphaproteobacteria bacterium]|nr:MAG: transcription-repair coupling factor [Alphaproteobacteria bacterium]
MPQTLISWPPLDSWTQAQTLAGAPEGHDARLLADLARLAGSDGVLHIAADDWRVDSLRACLAFFAPDIEVLVFPAWDCLPYDRASPQPDVMAARLAALHDLSAGFDMPRVVLTTPAALLQRLPPPQMVARSCLRLTPGVASRTALHAFLAAHGYRRVATVREAGEYAVRGSLVDVFPPHHDKAARVDFFDDVVESIRHFDPASQRSLESLDHLDLMMASEVPLNEETIASFRAKYRLAFGVEATRDPIYEHICAGRPYAGHEHWLPLFFEATAWLPDYLPAGMMIVQDEQAGQVLAGREQQVSDLYAARREAAAGSRILTGDAPYRPVAPESFFISGHDWDAFCRARRHVTLSGFAPAPQAEQTMDGGGRPGRTLASERAQPEGPYAAVIELLAGWQAQDRRVLLACASIGTRDRLSHMLREHGLQAQVSIDRLADLIQQPRAVVGLAVLPVDHGFISPDLAVLTETDILGDKQARPSSRRRGARVIMDAAGLTTGDLVVHREHGVGRYDGLETLEVGGAKHDCLKLVYDGGDRLFVPVENLDVLSRYGAGEAVLDKLGGVAWQTRQARVKKRLRDMAQALLKIAAERELKEAEPLAVATEIYQEFAARFPYAETEDQERAINDVLDDLAKGRPMDRLICGDVGFGKTEVALRAAYVAVMSGWQVAFVVPTTLLARQHERTLRDRFRGVPVRMAQLSRMVTAKDAKQVRAELAEGKIDIIVGTHALLGKEVQFKRLGLLIIDEEQHFGVKQKERMKELRAGVHVLTLSATPIPRTLQLAMSGVRSLSLIATPPVDRLAVQSFALPFDPVVLREALMREHGRGGQSFFVCPRVEDLDKAQTALQSMVPELRVTVAHGRLTPTALEDVMTGFDARRFDVLLATDIIESGLDFTNANTIIIHRADMFGLAQLYQLRGRVGRGRQRGYAYLTWPSTQTLSDSARQRLQIIEALDTLGAGFQLASHDLDLRGAGNLLGEEQSGHIREVGIELYQNMLEEAVQEARARQRAAPGDAPVEEPGAWTPQINLGLPVLIPQDYVADLDLRLGLYRRLADLRTQDEIESVAAEWIDRFGPLPNEVENLIETIAVRELCRRAHVARLDLGATGAVIGFHKDSFPAPERLVAWIQAQAGRVRLRPDQRLSILGSWENLDKRAYAARGILSELVALLG